MILVKNKKEICKKMVKGMAVGMTAMLLVETAVNAASVEKGDKDFTEKDRIVTSRPGVFVLNSQRSRKLCRIWISCNL